MASVGKSGMIDKINVSPSFPCCQTKTRSNEKIRSKHIPQEVPLKYIQYEQDIVAHQVFFQPSPNHFLLPHFSTFIFPLLAAGSIKYYP